MEKCLQLPLDKAELKTLRCGNAVRLSGVLYTARDAAHKRLVEMMQKGEALPFPVEGATIYYVGPTPAPPGAPIGSAGPTTSYRMDAYAPTLLNAGLAAMIGKGKRSDAVVDAMVENGAVYFGAIGGAGALLASCVKRSEVIAFPELGAEAVHRLEVEDFPVTVVVDTSGASLYDTGPREYLAGRTQNL